MGGEKGSEEGSNDGAGIPRNVPCNPAGPAWFYCQTEAGATVARMIQRDLHRQIFNNADGDSIFDCFYPTDRRCIGPGIAEIKPRCPRCLRRTSYEQQATELRRAALISFSYSIQAVQHWCSRRIHGRLCSMRRLVHCFVSRRLLCFCFVL